MKQLVAPVNKVPGKNREERASWLQDHLVQSLRQFTGHGLVAGAIMWKMDEERYYEELGFNSMREYLVSPEIDMRADVAYRLMRVYKAFVVVGSLELESLVDVSISKLDIAQRYLDRSQAEDLVEMAKKLTRSDLEETLAEKFNEGKKKKRAKRAVTCPNCGEEFVP